jgi:dCMP deaminase
MASADIDCGDEPTERAQRRHKRKLMFLDFAIALSDMSTCERLSVGCVITDEAMTKVLAIGYNGNAKGLPNCCDDPSAQGNCGCIHAEMNALLKVDGSIPDKVAFVRFSPCVMCAKAMVNANVGTVYYGTMYRMAEGALLLGRLGIDGGLLLRNSL